MRKRIGLPVLLAVVGIALASRAGAGLFINQGASCTNSGDVVLSLSYPPYIYAVTIANEDNTAASTSVTSPIGWALSAEDGLKTVTATYYTSTPYTCQTGSYCCGGYTLFGSCRGWCPTLGTCYNQNIYSESASITLDTVGPGVTGTTPAADATEVGTGTHAITATFSEAIDPATVSGTTFTVDHGLSGTIAYDAGTRRAVLTLNAPPAYATTYTAILTSAIRDPAGNPLLPEGYSWSFTTGSTPAAQSVVPKNDYDGDGLADIAVYRPSSGVWYLLRSFDGYEPSKYKAYLWGNATDIPVPGDYDGDGKSDIAVFRPSSGVWFLLRSSDGYDPAKYRQYWWGDSTVGVVAGDFDGDGKADITIYDRVGGGWWHILRSSDGFDWNFSDSYQWGNATDTPVAGDYDGDGKTDIAVYRPADGVWYILQSSDGYAPVLYKSYKWGGEPDDVPVPGDYDGDGKTDIAVYRPSSGVWYLLQSTDGYAPDLYKAYKWGGDADDVPVPGDHDGDGKTDIVLYRPSSGVWYLLLSTDGYDQGLYKAYKWGDPADKPVMGRN